MGMRPKNEGAPFSFLGARENAERFLISRCGKLAAHLRKRCWALLQRGAAGALSFARRRLHMEWTHRAAGSGHDTTVSARADSTRERGRPISKIARGTNCPVERW
jgi:hypothetical protein